MGAATIIDGETASRLRQERLAGSRSREERSQRPVAGPRSSSGRFWRVPGSAAEAGRGGGSAGGVESARLMRSAALAGVRFLARLLVVDAPRVLGGCRQVPSFADCARRVAPIPPLIAWECSPHRNMWGRPPYGWLAGDDVVSKFFRVGSEMEYSAQSRPVCTAATGDRQGPDQVLKMRT